MSSTTINNPEPSANTLSHQKVSRLTSTALFAALICVTTAYIFHIPFGVNGGYVHIGDSLIYLAAAFLPTPYAMFAGAIGGAMADILTGKEREKAPQTGPRYMHLQPSSSRC